MVDLGDDGNGYAFFAVADFTKAPDELVQALEEMRISPLTVLAP